MSGTCGTCGWDRSVIPWADECPMCGIAFSRDKAAPSPPAPVETPEGRTLVCPYCGPVYPDHECPEDDSPEKPEGRKRLEEAIALVMLSRPENAANRWGPDEDVICPCGYTMASGIVSAVCTKCANAFWNMAYVEALDRVLAAARRLPVVEREREHWKGEATCDSCAGEGRALDGGPCGCGGTGRLAGMVTHLRARLFDVEREREGEEYRADMHARINEAVAKALDNPTNGPGSSWHDLGEKVASRLAAAEARARTYQEALEQTVQELEEWGREIERMKKQYESPFVALLSYSTPAARRALRSGGAEKGGSR